MKKNIKLIAFIAALAATLVGCQTMHGLGEDISSGGKALSKAADPAKKKPTKMVIRKVPKNTQSPDDTSSK